MTSADLRHHPDTYPAGAELCVLGCADRTRTDVWPRPPRPSAPGQLTCRACADRILRTLDEVLGLAVALPLVAAAGSVPVEPGQSKKLIKDEPVAPIPVRLEPTALTDPRSKRGGYVPPHRDTRLPDAPLDVDGRPMTVEQCRAVTTAAEAQLRNATSVFGARSKQARAAATDLARAQAGTQAATALARFRAGQADQAIDAHDGEPTSVVGFLDQWTDYVRIHRNLRAGPCQHLTLLEGELGGKVCDQPMHYVRIVRVDPGAQGTGLLTRCPAGHLRRVADHGDLTLSHRGAHGHRATAGPRYGRTLMTSVGMLRRHNEWLCSDPGVVQYVRQLKALRAALGQAHAEPRPRRIGVCPTPTGTGHVELQPRHDLATGREHVCTGPAADCTWTRDVQVDVADLCGQPLYAQAYNDSIECTRCGRTWGHREWRHLGRTMGVLP